jgi:hypothetical protein
MGSVTRVQEAAEAICGALYNTEWELMGESDGGASTWFIRGAKPKQVRVEVQRSRLADYVIVNVEWFNLSLPGKTIRGKETLQIPCTPAESDFSVRQATELAVVRCLEILKDVVAGTGVASRESLDHLKFD